MSDARLPLQLPRRRDERLALVDWPELAPVRGLRVEADALLVACGGFEDRAAGLLEMISPDDIAKGARACLIKYEPHYQQNATQRLRNAATRAGMETFELTYDRRFPAGAGDKLLTAARGAGEVHLDISGMSRLLVVQTLVALLRESETPVTLYYGEARDYPPTRAEFMETERSQTTAGLSYISSGIFEIAAVPELASASMVGEAIRLVSFPSFDPSQLSNLLQELQPTYGDFVHGVPPRSENRWREDAIRKMNMPLLEGLATRSHHRASTLDYRETLEVLLEIYRKRSMFDRIVVAPMGSKMQAVAVGMFRAVLEDIQVVYPTPREFLRPARHTLGMRGMYRLELPDEVSRLAVERHG